MAKEDWKYVNIGQVVRDKFEPKNEDGSPKLDQKTGKPISKEYLKLRLGARLDKDGNVANNVNLSDEDKKSLGKFMFEQDIYLFEPSEKAPDFVVRNVSVKKEDLDKHSKSEGSGGSGKVEF